jgi:amino acid transporter
LSSLNLTNKDSVLDSVTITKKISLLPLVGIIFFTVSGGAFGLEPLISQMNPGWTIVLLILTPLLWSLPTALMVAELSSMMPHEGGYYRWVRTAMGDFWGVMQGWWTICFTAVDMAIYPVLFVNYFAYFFPELALDENTPASPSVFLTRWLIALAVVCLSLSLNYLGARTVGRSALVTTILVLSPFIIFVLMGFSTSGTLDNSIAAIKEGLSRRPDSTAIASGLAVVLWNYCAWDNVSTFAGEVDSPQKTYPKALGLALPLVILAYSLPVLIGLGFTTSPEIWNESAGWPKLAEMIGGKYLGILLAFAALISAWGLFNSQLLYVSRLPYAMAQDGWLPSIFSHTSKKTGVPIVALLVSSGITALFCALSFGKLVIIDILLYAAELSLQFIALLILRLKHPDLPRPFRIPGNWPVLLFVVISPLAVTAIVVIASIKEAEDNKQLFIVPILMASALIIYFGRKSKAKPLE